MRRKGFVITVAFVSALISTSFSITGLANSLEIWTFGGPMTEEMQFLADVYRRDNPHVQIEVIQKSGSQIVYMEQMMVAIAAGAAPDLMRIDGADAMEYAVRGMISDVTDALSGIRFTPGETEEMTFQGRIWGMPYRAVIRGLFKRTDLLEEVGLDPHSDPANLDELEDWNWRLTKESEPGRFTRVGLAPWAGNWGPPGWFAAFGGQLVSETDGVVAPTATHPNNLRAFEWIDTWAVKFGRQTAPVNLAIPGFTSGESSLLIQSTTAIGRLLDANVPFTTGRVPHATEGVNGTWGGGDSVVIPRGASNPDEARRFLQFISSVEAQISRYELTGAFPSNLDALLAIAPSLPPQYGPLFDQLSEVRPRVPLWTTYYDQHLRPEMTAMVAGNKTPLQALEDVQRAMVPLFEALFDQITK